MCLTAPPGPYTSEWVSIQTSTRRWWAKERKAAGASDPSIPKFRAWNVGYPSQLRWIIASSSPPWGTTQGIDACPSPWLPKYCPRGSSSCGWLHRRNGSAGLPKNSGPTHWPKTCQRWSNDRVAAPSWGTTAPAARKCHNQTATRLIYIYICVCVCVYNTSWMCMFKLPTLAYSTFPLLICTTSLYTYSAQVCLGLLMLVR